MRTEIPVRAAPWPVLAAVVLALLAALPAGAQSNVLDLRLFEMNDRGERTYHNFIYSRSLGDRLSFESFWLFLPQADDYDEIGAGLGYRVARFGDLSVSLVGYLSSASDEEYFQPTLFLLDAEGRVTGSFFLLHYFPLGRDGIHQWLIDPLEVQVQVAGPVSVGASGYFYRPQGGSWLTKVGPKLSVADKLGATELAVRAVNGDGGVELQIRRIFAF